MKLYIKAFKRMVKRSWLLGFAIGAVLSAKISAGAYLLYLACCLAVWVYSKHLKEVKAEEAELYDKKG